MCSWVFNDGSSWYSIFLCQLLFVHCSLLTAEVLWVDNWNELRIWYITSIRTYNFKSMASSRLCRPTTSTYQQRCTLMKMTMITTRSIKLSVICLSCLHSSKQLYSLSKALWQATAVWLLFEKDHALFCMKLNSQHWWQSWILWMTFTFLLNNSQVHWPLRWHLRLLNRTIKVRVRVTMIVS